MAENPFVDRMKQLVSDSTDAKRIEHFQSVAELQEKNKQRVKELIEKDKQRLEQIEKSEEILLSDALEAVNEITPVMMTKDGSISFVSEAFAFIDREDKDVGLITLFHTDLAIWDKETLTLVATPEMLHQKPIKIKSGSTFRYSAQGDVIWQRVGKKYSYSTDWKARVSEGILRSDYGFGTNLIHNFAMSPSGNTIAVNEGSSLAFVSTRTKLEYKRLRLKDGGYGMTYSPDGKSIALSRGKEVVMLDAWSGEETQRLAHKEEVCAMAFHPTLPTIVIAGGTSFFSFDKESGKAKFCRCTFPITDIAVSPDGKLLALAGLDDVRLYNFGEDEFNEFKQMEIVGFSNRSIEFDPRGINELEGFWEMLVETKDYIEKGGLKMITDDLTNFTLSWKRQVDI